MLIFEAFFGQFGDKFGQDMSCKNILLKFSTIFACDIFLVNQDMVAGAGKMYKPKSKMQELAEEFKKSKAITEEYKKEKEVRFNSCVFLILSLGFLAAFEI